MPRPIVVMMGKHRCESLKNDWAIVLDDMHTNPFNVSSFVLLLIYKKLTVFKVRSTVSLSYRSQSSTPQDLRRLAGVVAKDSIVDSSKEGRRFLLVVKPDVLVIVLLLHFLFFFGIKTKFGELLIELLVILVVEKSAIIRSALGCRLHYL
jgi:hypothetical protein